MRPKRNEPADYCQERPIEIIFTISKHISDPPVAVSWIHINAYIIAITGNLII